MDAYESLYAALGAAFAVFAIVYIGILVLIIASQWKIFSKAGQPGWAVLIPFYNLYVYTQVIKRPGWWMLLYFSAVIPIIGAIVLLVIAIIDTNRLSKVFGKSAGCTVGLIFLAFIFYPMLAFGSATYDASRLGGESE